MLTVILGYFIGSILGGKIYGFFIKRDLAEEGSGNTGARNAMRIGGKKAFLLVYGIDILKTVLVLAWSGEFFWWAALFLTIGHLYPFYSPRKGGKGYAVFSGIVLASGWYWFAGGIASLRVLSKVLGNSTKAGMVMLVLLPVLAYGNITDFFLSFLILALIIFKHRENLREDCA